MKIGKQGVGDETQRNKLRHVFKNEGLNMKEMLVVVDGQHFQMCYVAEISIRQFCDVCGFEDESFGSYAYFSWKSGTWCALTVYVETQAIHVWSFSAVASSLFIPTDEFQGQFTFYGDFPFFRYWRTEK